MGTWMVLLSHMQEMWNEICRISLAKLHVGKCLEDDVRPWEIFSLSVANNAFTYEMNHAGSISYYHISENVRKMISGVLDNFLFQLVNTLSPLFSVRHFQMHFLEWKWISIKISPKFVLDGPINSIPALIPIMVWCQSGDKPLSESMMA